MTPSDSIRHNARIVRQHVRGKSKKERHEYYALLSAGPLGLMLKAVDIISKASQPVTVNIDNGFDAEFERIQASIRSGARPRFDSRKG